MYLLSDRDNILKIAETHVDQLNKERCEIKELNREVKETQEALNDAQSSLQQAENEIKITNHSREQEDKERQVFFLEVIDELDSIQHMYALDNCLKQSSTKVSDHFQLIDNPVFEVDADWISDNPLFEVNEDSNFD